MKPSFRSLIQLVLIALGFGGLATGNGATDQGRNPAQNYLELVPLEGKALRKKLRILEEGWHDGDAAMVLEVLRIKMTIGHKGQQLRRFLEKQTGIPRMGTLDDGWQWVWAREETSHPQYVSFKAALYSLLDPSFRQYFKPGGGSRIRLDEVRWGGIERDGIPPLNQPAVVHAEEATYLKGNHVVFGVYLKGEARAYPKRILAWHEVVKDTLGGRAITGVYCTLCGTMVVYDPIANGTHHELGTSGFLYRSNKLMYDAATFSLWNTLEGSPVVGPLVGKNIQLQTLPVVTTTWNEWRKRHPDTTVLSLHTGYQRDYGEGVAYRSYFASDDLMFKVPSEVEDKSLPNKREVIVLRSGFHDSAPVAIDTRFLKRQRVFAFEAEERPYVVVTDPSKATRIYEGELKDSLRWKAGALIDAEEQTWQTTEEALLGPGGQSLPRVSAHRAFWFGWHAMYPDTRLIR